MAQRTLRAMRAIGPILRCVLPACYLAASWTWVIGMWLPVNLARDFGWPSFVVFALPNVIGAALVGFVFRPRPAEPTPRAQQFLERHRAAIHWFSFITICLHLFFCGVLAREHLTDLPLAPLGGVSASMTGLIVLAAIIALLPMRFALPAAALIITASMVCAIGAALGNPDAFALPPVRGEFTSKSWVPLVLTAPAIWLGFLACPHLDGTILRIRRDTADPAGLYAFILGFAGLFLLMILMTLGYAGGLLHTASAELSPFIVLHIFLQSAFTIGVHARAMAKGGAFTKIDDHTKARRPARRRLAVAAFTLALMPMLGTGARDLRLPFTSPGYGPDRLIYDTFMAAYAIVFPAYLWVCAVPLTPVAALRPHVRSIGFAIACALALPCLALGVIGPFRWAIPIGVTAILAAPWALRIALSARARIAPIA